MFISVEGIEGCGKSTLVNSLGQYLQERNIDYVITKEPGSTSKGKIVITDRYIDSTYAYQGAGRGVSKSIIDNLVSQTEIMLPDRTILLDIDPEVGLKRASTRNELDRFESENIVFHKRLRKSFLDAAGTNPDRFITIDAEQEPEKILQSVINKLF